MKVLVLGSGAREHAIAWKLSNSVRVESVVVCPGNAGMSEFECWDMSLKSQDFSLIADRAKKSGIDLVMVGPDALLADGIVDFLTSKGLKTFGPTKKAAQIESSKEFSKQVMKSAGVPTADFGVCRSISEITKLLESKNWTRAVVKADGLALGKGVRVCTTAQEVLGAARDLFKISQSLVVEEFLEGQEISWLAICDGNSAALFPPARDYKRLLSLNQGPNTGGMGAFCPVSEWNHDDRFDQVEAQVFKPVLKELDRLGFPFVGVLYAGLMVSDRSIKVLEFNARFGDPETQVLLPQMEGDLLEWILAAIDRKGFPLNKIPSKPGFSVYVVAASKGYPDQPLTGIPMQVIPKPPEGFVAGLKSNPNREPGFVTSGGRVLGALGYSMDLKSARHQAYERLKKFKFEGMQFREDVAL
jgi:phosphoribosylamine--glycine ligase